jgi:hypothetical protein
MSPLKEVMTLVHCIEVCMVLEFWPSVCIQKGTQHLENWMFPFHIGPLEMSRYQAILRVYKACKSILSH